MSKIHAVRVQDLLFCCVLGIRGSMSAAKMWLPSVGRFLALILLGFSLVACGGGGGDDPGDSGGGTGGTSPPAATACSHGTPNGMPPNTGTPSTTMLTITSPSTNPVILDLAMFSQGELCLVAGGVNGDDASFSVDLSGTTATPSADQDRFSVRDTGIHTAALTFKVLPSYHSPNDANADGTYEVVVVARNDQGVGNSQRVAGVMLNIQVIGSSPVISGGPFTLMDNAALGAMVGQLTATNTDSEALTWSITGGNADNLFNISNAGTITVAQALVTAAGGSGTAHIGAHNLQIRLVVGTGGASHSMATKQVMVTIENADLRIEGGPFRIAVTALADTEVGTLTLLPAAPSGIQWSITSGNTGGLFAVSNTGVITTTAAYVTMAGSGTGHEPFYDLAISISPTQAQAKTVRVTPYLALAAGEMSPNYSFSLTEGNAYTFTSDVACPTLSPGSNMSCCLMQITAPTSFPVAGLGDSLPLEIVEKTSATTPEVRNDGGKMLLALDQVAASETSLQLRIGVPSDPGLPASGTVCEASRPAMETASTTAARVVAPSPQGQIFDGTARNSYATSATGSLIGFVASQIGDQLVLRAAAEPSSAASAVIRIAPNTEAVVETMIHKSGTLPVDGSVTGFMLGIASVFASEISDIPPRAIDMHGSMLLVREYMAKVLDRRSYDTMNGSMYGVIDYVYKDALNREAPNAIYVDSYVLVAPPLTQCANPNTCPSFAVALDIMGHEWAHGILNSVSSSPAGRLLNFGDGGSLSEAFPDWFGTAVEAYYRGGASKTPNWTFGETASHGLVGDALRSLEDPRSIRDDADCYRATSRGWDPRGDADPSLCTAEADCIYNNAGVPNKMFYLLVNGHTAADSEVHAPVPIDTAIEVALEAATNFWVSSVKMPGARSGMVMAATAMMDPSVTAEQVEAAWLAVGVTDTGATSCP